MGSCFIEEKYAGLSHFSSEKSAAPETRYWEDCSVTGTGLNTTDSDYCGTCEGGTSGGWRVVKNEHKDDMICKQNILKWWRYILLCNFFIFFNGWLVYTAHKLRSDHSDFEPNTRRWRDTHHWSGTLETVHTTIYYKVIFLKLNTWCEVALPHTITEKEMARIQGIISAW